MYKILIIFLSFINIYGANFDQEEKDYLYNQFHTEYYWADKVPTLAYNNYITPNSLIDALKYNTYDKWSYSETLENYNNRTNQKVSGFGLYVASGDIIRLVVIDSPSYEAGLRRGDIISTINDEAVNANVFYSAQNKLNTNAKFKIIRDGKILTINVVPKEYTYKVSKKMIYKSSNGLNIGHFIYNSFSSKSSEEIDETFTYFKNNNIDELIIDLRYNLGGSLSIASLLLDKIAGKGRDGLVQAYTKWNDNNQDKNYSYTFMEDDNSLNLKRVFFLTSYNTASASEMIINSLKPYIDVKVIGSRTRGKPVGMRGKSIDEYVYWLINFTILNANNEGNFFNGIDVNCNVSDNLDFPRLDINGNMVNEALYYIENNQCSYGAKVSNTYESSFEHLEKILSGKYTIEGNTSKYFYLNILKNDQVNIDLQNSSLDVRIYNENINIVVPKFSNDKTINLEKDKYLIKIDNNSSTSKEITFSSSLINDKDKDTIEDSLDNCIDISNPLQEDLDKDGIGDICDIDDDNDGMSDEFEDLYSLDKTNSNDASLDSDNDNFSNLEEYNNGTNPKNALSKLFTINLIKGWNLISLELDSNFVLLNLSNNNIEVIRSLQNTGWKDWNKNSNSNTLNSLKDGYGYWIKVSNDTTLSIKGDGSADKINIINNQWNMIGSIEINDIDEFFTNNPNIKIIWTYKDNKYYAISNDLDLTNDLNNKNIPKINNIKSNESFFVK